MFLQIKKTFIFAFQTLQMYFFESQNRHIKRCELKSYTVKTAVRLEKSKKSACRDLVYTINGWIKSLNGSRLHKHSDPCNGQVKNGTQKYLRC